MASILRLPREVIISRRDGRRVRRLLFPGGTVSGVVACPGPPVCYSPPCYRVPCVYRHVRPGNAGLKEINAAARKLGTRQQRQRPGTRTLRTTTRAYASEVQSRRLLTAARVSEIFIYFPESRGS